MASTIARYIWAAPTTMVGLTAGLLTMATGGRWQVRRGALEFYGGFATWLARAIGFGAMTLGHVIIGRDAICLDLFRDHEQAHVRQVERWGFAFIPAYFAASYIAWRKGLHYYHDNWFERDARLASGEVEGPGIDLPGVDEPEPLLIHHMDDETDPFRPSRTHAERHFTASELVRDVVIGMSDGLTVPFALAAGLSGTSVANSLIVTAGLAEIAAGSIAMGLGGYLAARSDAEHFATEKLREEREVAEVPDVEEREVAEIFEAYGLNPYQIEPILDAFRENPAAWVDFMMRFELGLEKPDPRRAFSSALTIAVAYIVGGLVPLSPYMLPAMEAQALPASVAVTLLALFVFGYIKGRYTGTRPWRSAAQTTFIGGMAASAAFLIARVFS
jgi:VIT1/CCC1 family predicted Fe2+/Mn2+ transporter